MPGFKRPELPEGAHRDFNNALHDRHAVAGLPSIRRIAEKIGKDVISTGTIHRAFSSSDLPIWGNVELIAEALNVIARRECRSGVEQLQALWLKASKAPSTDDLPLPGRLRVVQALVLLIEWVNAPVLPFPTLTTLRRFIDSAANGLGLRRLNMIRRDGNGETVLIFSATEDGGSLLLTSDVGAQVTNEITKSLDALMEEFCRGRNFNSPFPQVRVFAHGGTALFDGVDYSGPVLETMEAHRLGMTIQDGLVGDYPGVIAIASGSVYRAEAMDHSKGDAFSRWVRARETVGDSDPLDLWIRLPKR
ncbi:hypothetical protein ABZ615_02570 [Streptomyces sp. NPDC007325]|uniref:hypothetical protein n=1 Tax=Streptomyces sp. NPDC007325 TaxID=3154588 RepID=UPI0033F82472